jgi:hypothetical protein
VFLYSIGKHHAFAREIEAEKTWVGMIDGF